MAQRYKPATGKIKSLEEANTALKEIGLLELEIGRIDADANKRIAEIKEECAKQGEGLRSKIINLTTLLGAYAEYNRDELFKDKKSAVLSFGEFGFRKSSSIHVKKTTLELLQKLKMDRFIRVKAEPDKEAMSELDDEVLAQVDAVRKVKDDFFCKANTEEVNKDLLKEQVA
jgi:phage host-nuclease inhibitor protein Gam